MDIFKQTIDDRARGRSFALATIIRKQGSSPREVGARMIVYADGSTWGTVGGGMFEKLVTDDCVELLKSEADHLVKTYKLAENGENATGMHCGGETELFLERFGPLRQLVIFGGGHVGRELARVSEGLGFAVTVVDDRSDILSGFAVPINTVQVDAGYKTPLPPLGRNCFVVIVTRSHESDRAVLEYALENDCAYVGMIGSKTKIAKLFANLKANGVARERLESVHTPIGLDIDAEGPAEIAVAIAAELIAVKNRVSKQS